MNWRGAIRELRRRHVLRVAAAYAVTAWLLTQLAAIVFPTFEAPHWVLKAIIAVLAIFFPVALVLAWAFELTPDGVRRTEPLKSPQSRSPQFARRIGIHLNIFISVLLAIAVAVLAWRLSARPQPPVSMLAGASAGPASAAPAQSVAVLPFENLSAEKANEYFAQGIQEELLTRLATLNGLKVISRTSTLQYQTHPPNLKIVAQELGVATVLEGGVQKFGDRVRINVQLIDARTDRHLWAATYDRDLGDIFAVESEIAGRVATVLRVKLEPRETRTLTISPTRDERAYVAFLRGEFHAGRVGNAINMSREFKASLRSYREAVTRDPGFALAWAKLALVQMMAYWYRIDHTPERLSEARAAANRALALAPDQVAARLALGFYHYWGHRDYARALVQFRRAQDLEPQNTEVHQALAAIYRRRGQWNQAISEWNFAIGRDPRNVEYLTSLAETDICLRRYEDAGRLYARALAIDPRMIVAAAGLASAEVMGQGDTRTALRVLDAVPARFRNETLILGERMRVLVYRHSYAEARRVLESYGGEEADIAVLRAELLRWQDKETQARTQFRHAAVLLESAANKQPDSPVLHRDLALAYASLGKASEAVREAKRAIALRPLKKDAYSAPYYLKGLAEVYLLNGKPAKAIALLDQLLKIPGGLAVSVHTLRLNPIWDPLRNNPRFQALLAKYGGKRPPASATLVTTGA